MDIQEVMNSCQHLALGGKSEGGLQRFYAKCRNRFEYAKGNQIRYANRFASALRYLAIAI